MCGSLRGQHGNELKELRGNEEVVIVKGPQGVPRNCRVGSRRTVFFDVGLLRYDTSHVVARRTSRGATRGYAGPSHRAQATDMS